MVLIDGGPEGFQWFKSEKKEKNMSERITAEEARRKSTTLMGEKVKQQLDQCEESIRKAILENKLSVNVIFKLEQLAKKDLESRGFIVTYKEGDFSDPREHSYTIISW
jgi:hypothetical protein